MATGWATPAAVASMRIARRFYLISGDCLDA
jgi:hypothetical protein